MLKSIDAGASWRTFNTGLNDTSVGALVIDPLMPTTLYAGTDAGVFSIQQVAPHAGDCDAGGSVTVDEIIILVNIALGQAQASACPQGIPSGTAVDIGLIIEAVDDALNGLLVQSHS